MVRFLGSAALAVIGCLLLFGAGYIQGEHDVKSRIIVERHFARVSGGYKYFGKCFVEGDFVYCAQLEKE